jgi:sulfatase modifying factor 1
VKSGAVASEGRSFKSTPQNVACHASSSHYSFNYQRTVSRRKFLLLGIGILGTATLGASAYYLFAERERATPTAITATSIATTKATTENMVLIPAGTFLMGREDREGWSPMANPEMFNDELPPHEVYVDAFYVDKYEVTNRQFKEFVNATDYVTDADRDGSSMVIVPVDQADEAILGTDIGWKEVKGATWRTPEGSGSNIGELMEHPVVHVSWNDANAYAKWVGKRLPTEAEWEKTARGGTNTNWFWGDFLGEAGKYQNFYAEHRLDYQYPPEAFDGFDKTAPVGSFLPNGYGLYDTAGNVYEWVHDWYEYDFFSHSPRDNPTGPTSGETKVIKGGCWYLCECYTRPANREGRSIRSYDHGLGFRLALDAK